MCLAPGHNYQSCLWFWAWLLTQEDQHRETIETMPDHIREFLARHLEIMETGRDLDVATEQVIAMGIILIANQNDLGALNRYAERFERQELAQELDQPMGWQTMEIGQLRAMANNRRTRQNTQDRPHRNPKAKAQPKAEAAPGTNAGTATGIHSAENFQQNQALFNQQSLENQAQDQEQQSDQSAVTWNENQEQANDQVDWEGPSY